MNAQSESFRYSDTPLSQIISDLEDKFDIRFAYKSSLLEGVSLSYKKASTLKEFLNSISEETNLEFIFLDKDNIVIKSSFDSSFDSNELDEIVLLSEYLTSGFDQKKEDGSITLNPNKLGALPGLTDPDVLQSLQLLPGISSPTESASNLHIRGGTPDQNLILYDGIKIYHQGHMFGMISPFNPYIVQDVNVFRSGTNAQFGDRIAGVIDINSFDEVPTKVSGGAGTNLLHSDVYLQLPIEKDKIGLVLSARRSINDLFELPTFNSFSDKVFQNTKIEFINDIAVEEELDVVQNDFRFLDVNAKLIIQPNAYSKIAISSLLVTNSLNFENADLEGDGSIDKLELDNSGISAIWEYRPKGDFSLDASVNYSVFDSQYEFTSISDNLFNESRLNTNTVKDFGVLINSGYKVSKELKLSLGYELVNYDVGYVFNFNEDGINELSTFNSTLTGHNIYIDSQLNKNKFFLRGGVRLTRYGQRDRTLFEPRVYADYEFSDEFKIKASAEIKNQAISQVLPFEFSDLGLGDSVWVLFDDDTEVPLLNNKQVTFGFLFNKNGWKLDVEAYFKNVVGITSFTRGFGNSNSTSDEFFEGNSKVRGVDILLKKKINRFRTWLGYSYSKNDFEFPDIQQGSFPGNFDQRHVLSWTGSYKYDQFQFSLGWQFATGRPYTPVIGNTDEELVFGPQNSLRVLNYHKLDLSGFYDFYLGSKNQTKARLGLSLINIYNRDNVIDRAFILDENEQGNKEVFQQSILGLGFTPNLVFRVFF